MKNYPSFILKAHVVEYVAKKDYEFAQQLTNPTQTFSFEDYYFAPAMNGYLLRLPFSYEPTIEEFGKKIHTDFNKMKKDYVK